MNIYIAGPMAGLPGLNFPAFFSAEEHLRKAGHNPINPARLPQGEGLEHDEYINIDLEIIAIMADAVAFLPGWHDSMGASLEYYWAVELELKILHLKQCRDKECGAWLEATAENFGKHNLTKDGLGVYCRPCQSKHALKHRRINGKYVMNREEIKSDRRPGETFEKYCARYNAEHPFRRSIVRKEHVEVLRGQDAATVVM